MSKQVWSRLENIPWSSEEPCPLRVEKLLVCLGGEGDGEEVVFSPLSRSTSTFSLLKKEERGKIWFWKKRIGGGEEEESQMAEKTFVSRVRAGARAIRHQSLKS